MKKIVPRIIISAIIVLIAIILVRALTPDHTASSDGNVRVIIIDLDESTVFDGEIPFQAGDNFFDVLNRSFSLICAASDYSADPTCSYTFSNFGNASKVLLGISNNDFSILTDWTNTFLQFELYDGVNYYLATNGVSQIDFADHDIIRISAQAVLGGSS